MICHSIFPFGDENLIMSSMVCLPGSLQEAIERLEACYSARDIDGILSFTSPGFIGYGSGSDEVVLSAEELRLMLVRDFSQCESIRMTFTNMHVREDVRAGWMLADCTISAMISGKEVVLSGRMTAVFRKIPPGWQMVQTHFSLPCAGQETGESFPSLSVSLSGN